MQIKNIQIYEIYVDGKLFASNKHLKAEKKPNPIEKEIIEVRR